MKKWMVLTLAVGLAAAPLMRGADGPKDEPPPQGQGGPGGGGQGGPGGGGPGGPGGQQGPRGGLHVIPPFAMEQLNLTDDQKKQIDDLEKETKDKLSKILTAEQQKALEEMRPPGRGGQGGRGQGGGRGGPGGGGGQGGGGGGQGGDKPQRPQRPSN
jgi:hypothetical protein